MNQTPRKDGFILRECAIPILIQVCGALHEGIEIEDTAYPDTARSEPRHTRTHPGTLREPGFFS